MMNPAFARVLAAPIEDRRGLFAETGRRLGTSERNVEKDFWVCRVLDALFNELPAGQPRLLFKGGTSLSKAHGLIERFSEDIDITVFRDDLGEAASVEELEAMGRKARTRQLNAIRDSCSEYINGSFAHDLAKIFKRTLGAANVSDSGLGVVSDRDDPDGQTLLLWYPSATVTADEYIRPAVRIESGAKSALDPNASASVIPYVAAELDDTNFVVSNVTTVAAGRTFWDKIVILHGLRRWFDRRGIVRQEGQRVTRHYYDVYRLLAAQIGQDALANRALGLDSARHARMFFNRPDLDLDAAVAGDFSLTPAAGMMDALKRDYDSMGGMIFGSLPSFEDIIAAIRAIEDTLKPLR
ncbi:nucleotidyl transferase AbiEii/AbiGii toxin family protein [Mesorhizobium sp. M0018]|uniref:nucleotidyl transferase AbiEii/AbiGii toxin family protein n=1 Tax=Mesorhizobium sp. M0018 TaxID=2956844 RepID=UPI003335835E